MSYVGTRLKGHRVEPGPRVGLRITLAGDPVYVDLLRRAFPPPVSWYGPFRSFDTAFDHVVYARHLDEAPLTDYLTFAASKVFVPTSLDECWALDWHFAPDRQPTPTRNLVYRAKTYAGKVGDRNAADELAANMAASAAMHPALEACDFVVGIPDNPPKAGHNLPDVLAQAVAARLGITHDPALLLKVRPTPEIKSLPNEQKVEALAGAYAVSREIHGSSVLVVDDILRSGATLATVAAALREKGAKSVLGLVASKTVRD